MDGLGFYGGIYLGFMGGVVFSIIVGLLIVLSERILKKKEKGLEIKASVRNCDYPLAEELIPYLKRSIDMERSFHCPALGYGITGDGCWFHKAMCPEDCVNCLIPLAEVRG